MGCKDKRIIVTSFGTSFPETRKKTIDAIFNTIKEIFGTEYDVYSAFTSGFIIKKIKSTEGIDIDDVKTSLDRAICDGVKEVIVMPTHFMKGREFEKIQKTLYEFSDKFERLSISEPLLYKKGDYSYEPVVKALISEFSGHISEDMALIFMGHGSEADANIVYEKLNEEFSLAGNKNIVVGTVEAWPDLDYCRERVKTLGLKKILLAPLMVVAGDHAINDMAGEDSWRTLLLKDGFEVEIHLSGIGEIRAIHEIYADHVRDVIYV